MSRYDTDRALGYKDEAVHRADRRLIDFLSTEAEDWLARFLGLPGGQGDRGRRDRGWDVVYRGWRIDVKWTQSRLHQSAWHIRHEGNYPRLMVSDWKSRRAHIYALVIGWDEDERDKYWWADGWAYRREVEAAPLKPGGQRATSGESAPYYEIGFDYLRPLESLVDLAPR